MHQRFESPPVVRIPIAQEQLFVALLHQGGCARSGSSFADSTHYLLRCRKERVRSQRKRCQDSFMPISQFHSRPPAISKAHAPTILCDKTSPPAARTPRNQLSDKELHVPCRFSRCVPSQPD